MVRRKKYTLLNGNNESVNMSHELSGEAADQASHFVNVKASDEGLGIVFGIGLRDFSNYAEIMANTNDNSEFIGWYVGNAKISS